jgi:ElaB/YqjD/DUF883 family membrane-anchored ribosome-binding protein
MNAAMDNPGQPLPSNSGTPPVPATPSPELERLTRDFRAFLADCEALFRNAQSLTGEGSTVLRSELARKIADARVKLDTVRASAGEQVAAARSATEDYVRREPVKALALAAGAGVLVALLVTRR